MSNLDKTEEEFKDRNASENKTLDYFLQFTTELIKSEEVIKFLNEYNQRKLKENENDNLTKQKIASFNHFSQEEHNKRYFKFHYSRLWKEVIVTSLLLLSILILSCFGQLEKSTIGTLMGSIIGYTIGNMNGYINKKEN